MKLPTLVVTLVVVLLFLLGTVTFFWIGSLHPVTNRRSTENPSSLAASCLIANKTETCLAKFMSKRRSLDPNSICYFEYFRNTNRSSEECSCTPIQRLTRDKCEANESFRKTANGIELTSLYFHSIFIHECPFNSETTKCPKFGFDKRELDLTCHYTNRYRNQECSCGLFCYTNKWDKLFEGINETVHQWPRKFPPNSHDLARQRELLSSCA